MDKSDLLLKSVAANQDPTQRTKGGWLGNAWGDHWLPGPSGGRPTFVPALVCAELPGIEAKDLDVNVTDDELTIRGEKKSERESDEKGRYWSERTYGSFERTIPLPIEVDGEKAKSEFKKGVLRITLPKRKGAKPRSHKINVSG